LNRPLFIVNFKNYMEVAGHRTLELARAAERVSRELGVTIAVAPPTPYLAQVAEQVEVPVLAQHVELSRVGSTTGAIVPELVREAGVVGSLVNHSERRLSRDDVEATVARLHRVGLKAVVCAEDPVEVEEYARLNPAFLAIEPPELIGSGRAVSRARPEVITDSVVAAGRHGLGDRVLCGAGIVAGEDVAKAVELGAQGILVASGVVKAADWVRALEELAAPLVAVRR
jgi:triosephosphate isomerase